MDRDNFEDDGKEMLLNDGYDIPARPSPKKEEPKKPDDKDGQDQKMEMVQTRAAEIERLKKIKEEYEQNHKQGYDQGMSM